MQVSLEEIKQSGGYLEVEQEIPPERVNGDLNKDMQVIEPVKALIKFSLEGDWVTVNLRLEVTAEFSCSRCLEKFRSHMNGDFYGEFIPQGTEADDQTAGFYDEFGIFSTRSFVLESLLLLFPMKKLCRENCRGICPYCGVNLNRQSCDCNQERSDPRWEALRGLKAKNK